MTLPAIPEGRTAPDYYWELYRTRVLPELPKIPPDTFCNSRKGSSHRWTGYCQFKAGHGTSHRGEGRCRLHGGNQPRGIASHKFKPMNHRAWAAAMPSSIGQAYDRAISDPELIRMRSEIALVDARIAELFQGLPRDSALLGLRRMAGITLRAMTDDDVDVERVATCLVSLREAFEAVDDETASWTEIGMWIDRRRSLVESESRQAAQAQTLISADQMMRMVQHMIVLLRELVEPRVVKVFTERVLAMVPGQETARLLKT